MSTVVKLFSCLVCFNKRSVGKSKELRGLRLHAYVIHLVVMLPACKRARSEGMNYNHNIKVARRLRLVC